MTKTKNPVVHFEMPYSDAARVSQFYSTVFGWKMVNAGEAMGHYVTAETTDTGADNRPTTPGAINGGFYPLAASPTSKEPSVVISVDSIEESMHQVTAAGGTLLGKPVDIPGVGKYVSFTDTEGNRVSLLQPAMQQ